MRDRWWLIGYLSAVVGVTLVHQPAWLAAALVLVLTLAGKERWRLLKRTLNSVLAFNLTISLGYLVMAYWRGDLRPDYLILINLRVLLLVYLGFWTVGRINLSKALSFSATLSFLTSLAAGQMQGFRRVVKDFDLAFRSRNLVLPNLTDRMHHTLAQGQHLLDKAVYTSTEIGQAMRSRGCFDDPKNGG
jgi:cobalt/nickel transport system permease protein